MIIDAHMHVGRGDRLGVELNSISVSAEQLIEVMDRCGVDVGVVVPMSSGLNHIRYVGEVVERYPDRLVGFPWVDPNKVKMVEDVTGMFDLFSFRGLKLRPESDSYAISNIGFLEPVMEAAERLSVPIYVHSSRDSFLSSPTAVGRLAESFPQVTVIMGHMGGGSVEAISVNERHSNILLETSGVEDPGIILHAVERLGPDRVLFGSDFPYLSLQKEKAKVETLNLPEKDKRLIMGGNTARVLKIA